MRTMKKAFSILLMLFFISLVGCAAINETLGLQESPEKMALRFTKTWNTEFDRTIRLVCSHLSINQQNLILAQVKDASLTDQAKTDLLVKNTNPNLTADQKKLINLRKDILTKSKPFIATYNSMVLSGGSISSLDETQIERLLEDLLTKYLIK